MNRYKKFVPVVLAIAALSKDRSTRVGAVALGPGREIRSTGYNGFARGVRDEIDARHERPEKYKWTAHAEENLVAQAARSGTSLYGCTVLVSTLYPCTTCARMLIQAGVAEVVAVALDKEKAHGNTWGEEGLISRQMFQEAGVALSVLDD